MQLIRGCSVDFELPRSASDELVPRLFAELFQTERSASQHARVEGERLVASPPGHAMLAVSTHARHGLPELGRLAAAERLAKHSAGAAIGQAARQLDWFGSNPRLAIQSANRRLEAGGR